MTFLYRRVHVGPRDFDNGGATDYWINFQDSANQVAAASATNPGGLSGWFHTTTSLVATAGTAGDLNSGTDYTPSHILTNAAADVYQTARIFGGFDQFQRVSTVLGYLPTKLILEFVAAFTVASANETTSFIGLCAPAVTDAAAAGGGGAVRSGGTASTFFLTSDAGSDAGANIDTAWHRWRIEITSAACEWFIDGTSQGTIALEADEFPVSFEAGVVAAGANDIAIGNVHCWYE